MIKRATVLINFKQTKGNKRTIRQVFNQTIQMNKNAMEIEEDAKTIYEDDSDSSYGSDGTQESVDESSSSVDFEENDQELRENMTIEENNDNMKWEIGGEK